MFENRIDQNGSAYLAHSLIRRHPPFYKGNMSTQDFKSCARDRSIGVFDAPTTTCCQNKSSKMFFTLQGFYI